MVSDLTKSKRARSFVLSMVMPGKEKLWAEDKESECVCVLVFVCVCMRVYSVYIIK